MKQFDIKECVDHCIVTIELKLKFAVGMKLIRYDLLVRRFKRIMITKNCMCTDCPVSLFFCSHSVLVYRP